MGKSGYTSVTIHEKKYKKIRSSFDKHIKKDIEKTFTGWVTDLMENSLDRTMKLKTMFPHLSVIKILTHGLVIEDSKNNIVVKVVMNGKNITCSDSSKQSENYILYATLHPHFWI